MKIILLIITCSLTFASQAQNYWQQEINYTIDVSLNDVENSLNGFMKIQYINHSPDTLHFIWFHLWPNAYKNDKTAFSDQLLINGRSDFYFSDKEQKGYINHLDFRVDDVIAHVEDHPEFIDIVKVILPQPLPPGYSIRISTPFYEKLPFNFSRGGHVKQSYQITQWYPKPAVYDQQGWHPMPYLDQGEFYSEFGNYDVRITIPKNYIVAATGELQDEEEKKWMMNAQETRVKDQGAKAKDLETKSKMQNQNQKKKAIPNPSAKATSQQQINIVPSDTATKTLQFKQNNIHDFAWFADKDFIVKHDTIQLVSGRIIDAYSFYKTLNNKAWDNSISYIKDAVRFHSALIGEYPFKVITVVQAETGVEGGMEYPTITSISPIRNEKELDLVINHEIGHNWFYAIIASNERRYPWMDEGINTYYDYRYEKWKYKNSTSAIQEKENHLKWLTAKLPQDQNRFLVDILVKEKSDQPISTASEDLTSINYNTIIYNKTGLWMQQLEDSLGTPLFDSCMQTYFRQWQFRHPYPENFMSVMEKTSGENLHQQFVLLDKKGPLPTTEQRKKLKPAFLFSFNNTERFNYINIAPGIGYNIYDKLMIGAVFNNFNLPENNFQFFLVPLYATGSQQLHGIGDVSYSWHPDDKFQKVSIGIDASGFSTNASVDINNNKIFESFTKISPYIRLELKNKTALSSIKKWVEFKTYFITEKNFSDYKLSPIDSTLHPTTLKNSSRYINQLSINIDDSRILYPYNLQLQFQQNDIFYRINFTGNYFFNYANGGGMSVRLFAAKFGQWGNRTTIDAVRYEPKLLGVTGGEDYTYSNYFLGRSASYAIESNSIKNSGLAAQQIMIRDGGFKLRIDQYDFIQGRSGNWVSALNFNTSLPNHLFPIKLPIRIFFDVGTYAEAWDNNPPTSKFLYIGGLQLSLFKDLVNIYAPIIYSSDFSSLLKTIPEQNSFLKRLTFSIDIQNLDHKKNLKNIFFH